MKTDPKNSRRTFLKRTTLGSTAAIFGGSQLFGRSLQKTSNSAKLNDDAPLITRELGKTGFIVPVVSSGVIPTDNDNLAKAMLKSGMLHFDSAYSYGNGKVDMKIGELMKDFKREDFILSTKVAPETDRVTGLLKEDHSVANWIKEFDTSLERLQTDYVDILYNHAISKKEVVLHPDYIKALTEIKNAGKAKAIGVSTHSNVPEVIYAAIEAKVYDVVLIGINYLHNQIDEIKEAVKAAKQAGLGIVAMKVLAGMRNTKKDMNLIDKKAALKWILQDTNIDTAILSIRNYEDLENYLEVARDISMTEEENDALNSFRETASLFCSGCTTCLPQCPHKVEIPDFMRAYMYAYGYHDMKKSAQTIATLSNEPCTLCDECKVVCKSGYNIKDRITDIARLKNVSTDFLV